MPIALQSRDVYRMSRGSKGLATMPEIIDAAAWISQRLAQQLSIQGVERGKAAPAIEATTPLPVDARTASQLNSPVPVFRFQRREGLSLTHDLHQLADWLHPLMQQQWRDADVNILVRRAAADVRLPLPPLGGLLQRKHIVAFMRAVGFALGFEVEATDLAGARDAGPGAFQVRRKKQRTASLTVTVQRRSGHAKVCHIGVAPDDSGWYSQRVETSVYDNGSYTTTETPSGAIQGIGPDGTFLACADNEIETTFDDEFDYGGFVSATIEYTTVGWSGLTSAATSALEDAGDPEVLWTPSWLEAGWEAASAARNQSLSYSSSSTLGSVYGEGGFGGWNVFRPKVQIENTGQVPIEIEITFTRASDSTTEVLDPVTIAPGEVSDWITFHAAAAGESWTAAITRVGINGL